eukprot:1160514-Pelagomonas_calceolata.AAC.5
MVKYNRCLLSWDRVGMERRRHVLCRNGHGHNRHSREDVGWLKQGGRRVRTPSAKTCKGSTNSCPSFCDPEGQTLLPIAWPNAPMSHALVLKLHSASVSSLLAKEEGLGGGGRMMLASVLVVCAGVTVATVTDKVVINNMLGLAVGVAATFVTALYQAFFQGSFG